MGGFEQSFAEPFGIALADPEGGGEHPRLMFAIFVGGIEAIVF